VEGRYPLRCHTESGLSSPRHRGAIIRQPTHLATTDRGHCLALNQKKSAARLISSPDQPIRQSSGRNVMKEFEVNKTMLILTVLGIGSLALLYQSFDFIVQ
jgi:hypothetical protein